MYARATHTITGPPTGGQARHDAMLCGLADAGGRQLCPACRRAADAEVRAVVRGEASRARKRTRRATPASLRDLDRLARQLRAEVRDAIERTIHHMGRA